MGRRQDKLQAPCKSIIMKELDLHGLSHDRIKGIVSGWVHKNPPPCKIITGNSGAMERLVKEALGDRYYCEYESYHNLGALIVTRR